MDVRSGENASSHGTSGRVLLSGASGMLGRAIAAALRRRNVELLTLVRRKPNAPNELEWAPEAGRIAEPSRLEGLDAVIHLSGANVSTHRWTTAYKREIGTSRVSSTRTLATSLAGLNRKPVTFISASATGYYGNRGDVLLDESSPSGKGFFPELCMAWEAAAESAQMAGIRVVHPRIGVVLGHGGMLDKLAPIFRLGLGGRLGDGHQWISWISEADLVAAILFVLDRPALTGAINFVAPEPITNAGFTRELADALHRPAIFPAPALALRLAFGEMADEALLASVRVMPARLLAEGFRFAYPAAELAIRAALSTKTS